MTNFVKISEAASLGLHAVTLLACQDDRRATNQELSQALGASAHHLAKVMQRLVRAGLVDSEVGPRGGFRLAKAPGEILLLNVYEAIEGPLAAPRCLLGNKTCAVGVCVLGGFLQKMDCDVRDYLAQTPLAALVEGASGAAVGEGLAGRPC